MFDFFCFGSGEKFDCVPSLYGALCELICDHMDAYSMEESGSYSLYNNKIQFKDNKSKFEDEYYIHRELLLRFLKLLKEKGEVGFEEIKEELKLIFVNVDVE